MHNDENISSQLSFKLAVPGDETLILKFIQELASYLNLVDEVSATLEQIRQWIFEKKNADVLFFVIDEKEIGFVLFFESFSAFSGRPVLYMGDLYIIPEYRRYGIGKLTLSKLANIAVERGCARLEWSCIDWNESSIKFYLAMGAKPSDEWTTYTLSGDSLKKMAHRQEK